MAIVSIKRSAEEIAEASSDVPAPASFMGQEYPYGCCITLTRSELKKMGVERPGAGKVFKIEAVGFVRSTNESVDGDSDDPDVSVHIQFTDMGMRESRPVRSPGEVLYGKKDE